MPSHASLYCKTLSALPAPDAINAIHSAYMQFLAAEKGLDGLDNRPIMRELARLLTLSGHIGFDSPAPAAPSATEEAVEFTQAELQEAFDRVRDLKDWKAPITANVLSAQLDITCKAIEHFTATVPRCVRVGFNTVKCSTLRARLSSISPRRFPDASEWASTR